jgi:hypothetical protein
MPKPDSLLRLWCDIFVAHLLLVLAKAGKSGEPQPDVYYYLGDRYWRLAEIYRRHGVSEKAERMQDQAEWYLRASGGWDGGPPQPAAAMAMPIPKRPTFTAAIGRRLRKGPPDDAA